VWAWLLVAAGIRGCDRWDAVGGRGRPQVRLLVAIVPAVCGTVGLDVEHVHTEQQRPAEWAQASKSARAQLLPASPAWRRGCGFRAVADGDPTVCNDAAAPAAAAQLVTAADAGDCAGAVRVLSARVVDPRCTRRPTSTRSPKPSPRRAGGHRRCAGCAETACLAGILHGTTPAAQPPGPQLGRLDLAQVLGQG
jgi:hypothetical protein